MLGIHDPTEILPISPWLRYEFHADRMNKVVKWERARKPTSRWEITHVYRDWPNGMKGY